MDGERFDDLARILGAAATRKRVVELFIGACSAGIAVLTGFAFGDAARHHQRKHKKKKRRRRRRHRRLGGERLCPGLRDKVCHCPPGNIDNCQTTGNGKGHGDHPLDCCCSIDGVINPDCECPHDAPLGSTCCKPADTTCANDSQCCDNGHCCDIVDGVGTCQAAPCCIPLTCADFPGLCGPQDNGCGGQTPACQCEAGQVCDAGNCCTPLTCADDYPDQCGTFPDGCGGSLVCTCQSGLCCNGACNGQAECCVGTDCEARVCQAADCDDGDCAYSPVEDGEQGPLCDGRGEFCCNGDDCCQEGQVCTGQGCCTPQTCADFPGLCGPQNDRCGGQTASCDCPDPNEVCFEGGCCLPETKEQACTGASRNCGLVSDGCGGDIDCGSCSPSQTCESGICHASGGKKKRCTGKGLSGQPCKGKKCKCRGGRRCHNGRCCEPIGNGSRHCNANSDCCPGLMCLRKAPGQHKVCIRRSARAAPAPLHSTSASQSGREPNRETGARASSLAHAGAFAPVQRPGSGIMLTQEASRLAPGRASSRRSRSFGCATGCHECADCELARIIHAFLRPLA